MAEGGTPFAVGAAEELLSQAFNFGFDAKLDSPVRDPNVSESVPLAVAQAHIQTPQSLYSNGHEDSGHTSNSEGLLRDHTSNSSILSAASLGVKEDTLYQNTGSEDLSDVAMIYKNKKPRQLSRDVRSVIDDPYRQLNLLQSQNSELKRSIAASTRTIGQADDDTLRKGVTGLAFEIQDWAVNNVRKARLDISSLDETTRSTLSRICPAYASIGDTARIALCQAVICYFLMPILNDCFFFGLPSDARFASLRSTNDIMGSLSMYNHWRSLSVHMLNKSLQDGPATESAILRQAISDNTCEQVESIVEHIDTMIRAVMISPRCLRLDALRQIVQRTIRLARVFRSQRAVYSFDHVLLQSSTSPHFDESLMEGVPEREDDSLIPHSVLLVLWPSVVKHGDQNGDNMNVKNVLCKAKVFCTQAG